MADNLYTSSNSSKKITISSLRKQIKSDIKLLNKYLVQEVEVFEFKKGYIALAFTLRINLPVRPDDIDIRNEEPIVLVLHKDQYPHLPPIPLSNRRDFPADKLPHLNPVPTGFPAFFCLHRGSIDDWFAEHGIIDFVERLKSWLEDAASDNLIREGDEFEFTRINDSAGFIVFDETILINELLNIYNSNSGNSGYNFNFLFILDESKIEGSEKGKYSLKHKTFVDRIKLEKFKNDIKRINGYSKNHSLNISSTFGVVVYPEQSLIHDKYFSHIPNNGADLIDWASQMGIPLEEALKDYLKEDLFFLISIPVSIVIHRPSKVLNHISEYEILSFLIITSGNSNVDSWELIKSSEIRMLEHRNPVTSELARNISGIEANKNEQILIIGCGALGSKVAMHLVRTGHTKITFLDHDDISPHNLIRHSLFNDSVGANKAEQLMKKAKEIYSDDKEADYQFVKGSIVDLIANNNIDLNKYNTIIDCTASSSVFNLMTSIEVNKNTKYFKCELTNEGNYGITTIEGESRNPRIDDLQALLFDKAMEDKNISSWLNHEFIKQTDNNPEFEDIMVGMNCNSDTFKLPDDTISLHGSLMASLIRNTYSDQIAGIQLSQLTSSNGIPDIKSDFIYADKVDIIDMSNSPNWQIRLKAGVLEEMQKQLEDNSPNETGGILIGHTNLKRKIAYVTRIINAPNDSIKSPYIFVRGKQGLNSKVKEIRKKTGHLIDFVGEWHTHPNSSPNISNTDKDAVSELRKFLDPIPFPTILLIMSKTKKKAYIYGPKHIIDL